VSSGAWHDLTQPYADGMMGSPVHGVPAFTVEKDFWQHESGCDVSITRMAMGAHSGTHVDAARHFYPDGRSVDEYPVTAFVGAGVVLDVPRDGPEPITATDLERAQPAMEVGDIVFIRTGYAARFGDPSYLEHPYLSGDAAALLVDRKVRLVGLDALTPDMPAERRPPDFDYPVHRALLGSDIPIVENLGPGLAAVVGQRLTLGALPLRIVAADGAPVAAFAHE
jgi:kynurenine formamidase